LILITFLLFTVWSPCPPLSAQDDTVRIDSITIEGNRAMSAQQIRLLLRVSQEGREYVPENLQSDLRHVEKTYQDMGFLQVQLEAREEQILSPAGRKAATVRIVIREGTQFMTGKVSVNDTKALAPGALLQLSPLQKGQPYSPVKAEQWRSRVEDSYRSMGYLRSECPVRTVTNEAVHSVDCAMECVEGRLYTVGKIAVSGDASVSPMELKRRLLFSEGGIFNPEMLLLSLQFLNETRLYEPIFNSDVAIRIDDDKGLVDLSLRVVSRVR
jgi:outer membrane protein assembly factor BamA